MFEYMFILNDSYMITQNIYEKKKQLNCLQFIIQSRIIFDLASNISGSFNIVRFN